MDAEPIGSIAIVLGAGASRSVSYAQPGRVPSPLDSDFFDLLQRIPRQNKDEDAITRVLERAKELPPDFWHCMERSFYTLHLRSYLKAVLLGENKFSEEQIISDFAQAIEALLREAHDTNVCENHARLLEALGPEDAIVSFNYDLVVERSLGRLAEARGVRFGGWVYGLENPPAPSDRCPLILKLHGSSNWQLTKVKNGWVPDFFQTRWADFYAPKRPGYEGFCGKEPGIILPFWDKEIEFNPWIHVWKKAYEKLAAVEVLIVWGYSLPPTDIKTRELFTLALRDGAGLRVCVIDPSPKSRGRWRDILPKANYWEHCDIQSFFANPPAYWRTS